MTSCACRVVPPARPVPGTRHQTQSGDEKIARHHHRRRPGRNRLERNKTDERRRHHHFVHQRIHQLPEVRHDPVTTRDFAVEEIRHAGEEKKHKGRRAPVGPGRIERDDEQNRQQQSADG